MSFDEVLSLSFLRNTSKSLHLYFRRALYLKAAYNVIAKSHQINFRIKRNMVRSIFFAKIRSEKDKVAGWKFCNTEDNELKITYITVFRFTF